MNRNYYLLLSFLLTLYGWLGKVAAQSNGLPQPEIITQRQGLSQGFISSIVQDRQGFIWVGTLDGLSRYDGAEFKIFQPAIILEIKTDAQGRLWTRNERDLDRFDPTTETFFRFTQQPFYLKHFKREPIQCFLVDNRNRLWLGFGTEGLVCIDLRTNRFRRFRHQPGNSHSISHSSVSDIVQDRQGRIWLATRRGLDRFDESGNRFIHSNSAGATPNALPDSAIRGLYVRPDGDLLIVTQSHLTIQQSRTGDLKSVKLPKPSAEKVLGFSSDHQGNDYVVMDGLYRFNDKTGFRLLADSSGIRACRGVYVDRSDVLWVATNGAGIRKYNLRSGLFQGAPYRMGFSADLLTRILELPVSELPPGLARADAYNFRYTYDRQGNLWFSVGNSSVYRLDFQTKKCRAVPMPPLPPDDQADRPVLLTTDPAGKIWLARHLSAWRYDEAGSRWEPLPFTIRPNDDRQRQSLQFVVDQQAIWVITGSNGLFRTDLKTGQSRHYTHHPGDSTSLSRNNLTCIFADPLDANRLWIGTYGSGLNRFDKRTGQSQWLTMKNGLPNNVVYTAIPDRRGFLWIATNQGLCRLNRQTLQTRIYTHEDGLLADEFNRFHFLQLPDDRIALGGLEGITAFDPGKLREDTYQPPVQITAIQINNRPLLPGELTQNRTVSRVDQLDLKHDQNFITVNFAAMQYNRRSKIRFRYQLTGLDPDWIVTERPTAVYTDLRPGDYTLKLNASNTSGIWSQHVRTLTLTIHRPWWTSWWALTAYGLLLIGIGYGVVRAYLNRIQMRQSMELRQKEAEQLRMVDEMKSRFFANITHEFRTPITLIMTPAEQLMARFREPQDQQRLTTITRSANQLLDLVNQFLDLSKLEAGALKAEESRGNLREFIGAIVQSFQFQAEARGVDLRFFPENSAEEYWFDAGKLERIVFNLIANALKFTKTGGEIDCRLGQTHSGKVVFTIRDSGIGISADHLPHIFDRFYQVEDSSSGLSEPKQQGGTGIGLALVKELVELQGGEIRVQSTLGTGTEFTVELPYRTAVPLAVPTPEVSVVAEETDEVNHLLIVEDNQELATYIAETFTDSYRIFRASNGAEGLALALEKMPDLIISDVLMPVMNGYSLVRELKKDVRISHIPVILLTAKSAFESRMEGLATGANDYVTKPFHVEELRLRVRNQLELQRKLREWIRASLINPDSPVTDPENETSEPFLEILYPILEKNLDNSMFGVEELCQQMRMSRMSIYRKMKALTGLSTNEVIRNYRLKRAVYYLRQGLTSSETAYQVGFDSPAYFTKCFRELYQMTPTEFVAKGGIA
ncbi:hybrid sensor histidine kinase/response regulator transcription factor [Larkinella terrae]|nr:ATP-binding protein [Larkinella terrae]